MKNICLLVIIISLFIGNIAAEPKTNNQNEDTDKLVLENMTIKVIDPAPMIAPSDNERAMLAYTTGTQYLNEGKLEEAEKYLMEAIDLEPLFVDAMDHLGRVYRIQNRLRDAEEMYLKSIEINSENSVPYQNLAVVYRMQNRLNDAFELYKKMIQIDSNNPESYFGIGGLFYIVADYERAMPFFDKAIELYINLNSSLVYDAFYYKGMIFFKMDEYENALKYLEEAQKGNPNNPTIEKTIDEIKNKKT
jgi:tetratricopeptide (TPR) repeat protein